MVNTVRYPAKHSKCQVAHSWFYDNVYNINFYVVYGLPEELNKYCELEHEYVGNPAYFCGRSIFIEVGAKVIILFNSDAIRAVSSYRYIDIVVHECFHAVDHIFDTLGVAHNAEGNNEAWAYYLGFVTSWVTEFLNDSIRLKGKNGRNKKVS